MKWKIGLWVKYEFNRLTAAGACLPGYCYYKIKSIQTVKKTFTVAYPKTSIFSAEDGSIMIRGVPYPQAGKIAVLTTADESFVSEILKNDPACLMIFSNGETIAYNLRVIVQYKKTDRRAKNYG